MNGMSVIPSNILSNLLTASAVAIGIADSALAQEQIGNAAYQLLNDRVTENQSSFFVYRDADSGLNHSFPSGFFSFPTDPSATIDLQSACLDDALSADGCSSDPTRLDEQRGTVLRIAFSFDPAIPNEFAGINFEEPENYTVNLLGVGYDLRGTESLVLDARSPDGISVQFGVAGRGSPFFQIPSDWTNYAIPLDSLGINDLSDVHILFTVVTNDTASPNGGTILLDNVRFEPVPDNRSAVLGFPLSTETFGVLPFETLDPVCAPLPADQILRNATTIYESALTVLALIDRGLPEDLAAARLIADTFHYSLHHDNQGNPLPTALDGSPGLHTGYASGDIALLNDQGIDAGQAGEVRLAGFTGGQLLCGDTGFCLLLDGATGGNVAFAMLALLSAYEQFGELGYLEDARTLGSWVYDLLADDSGTGFGGYYLGYPDGGILPSEGSIDGKSTENNADIFVAFRRLASIEEGLGNLSDAELWEARANLAGDFAMAMFDRVTGCFFAGTVPVGTSPNLEQGIDPGGVQLGAEVINVFPFLDANSFTTLGLAKAPRYRNQIDWRWPAQCILDRFAKTVSIGLPSALTQFDGFSLVEEPVCGSDGVAWEFTGQAVVTMRLVDRLYGESALESDAQFYLSAIRSAQLEAPFGDGLGLVASTLQDGNLLDPIDQCLSTPFQCIPERVGLAATTWALFAERDLNPLEPPCTRDLILQSQTFDTGTVIEACHSITTEGDVTLASLGDLTLRSGRKIVLNNGFGVKSGGRFTAQIDPLLILD